MSDVGSDLRLETATALRGLSPLERIEVALRLGDADVALHRSFTGRSEEEARRVLARQRQEGRTPSRCAREP